MSDFFLDDDPIEEAHKDIPETDDDTLEDGSSAEDYPDLDYDPSEYGETPDGEIVEP